MSKNSYSAYLLLLIFVGIGCGSIRDKSGNMKVKENLSRVEDGGDKKLDLAGLATGDNREWLIQNDIVTYSAVGLDGRLHEMAEFSEDYVEIARGVDVSRTDVERDPSILGSKIPQFKNLANDITRGSISHLPVEDLRPIAYIINTEVQSLGAEQRRGLHWVSIFVDPEKRTVEYYDSMSKQSLPERAIRDRLAVVAESFGRRFSPGSAFTVVQDLSPKKTDQKDGYNCGVWATLYHQLRLGGVSRNDILTMPESYLAGKFLEIRRVVGPEELKDRIFTIDDVRTAMGHAIYPEIYKKKFEAIKTRVPGSPGGRPQPKAKKSETVKKKKIGKKLEDSEIAKLKKSGNDPVKVKKGSRVYARDFIIPSILAAGSMGVLSYTIMRAVEIENDPLDH